MILKDIAHIRLINQQIANTQFTTPKELVGWMGAMQAQDYSMVKWAMGIRLCGLSETTIEAAIREGELIRTHLLRPTWHIVSADDIYWMLELTAPHIKTQLKSRHKELGLTESVVAKSQLLLEKALLDGNCLTKDELLPTFKAAKLNTDGNRTYHLLLRAELDGLICSGPPQGKKPTYTLLEEHVPRKQPMKREEALAELVKRYFLSHGPATLKDFAWWSGLSITDARKALEMNKSLLISVDIDGQTYWFNDSYSASDKMQDSVYMLPAYDEYLISYKNRNAAVTFENHAKAVSSNGVFRPIIVLNGEVVGTWKRAFKKEKVLIETNLFTTLSQKQLRLIEQAATRYGAFLDKECLLTHS